MSCQIGQDIGSTRKSLYGDVVLGYNGRSGPIGRQSVTGSEVYYGHHRGVGTYVVHPRPVGWG